MRWLRTREPADAAVALLLLAACPLLKIPGRIWALLALPALIVGLLPRRGPRIVAAGYAAAVVGLLVLAQTNPVIMGYHLHLDFAPDWDALANSFLLYDNWHLLWYGAIAVALLGWRQSMAPSAAPLTVVVAGGVHIPCVRAAVHQCARMALRPDHRQPRDAAPCTAGRHLDARRVPRVGADAARTPKMPPTPAVEASEAPQERRPAPARRPPRPRPDAATAGRHARLHRHREPRARVAGAGQIVRRASASRACCS